MVYGAPCRHPEQSKKSGQDCWAARRLPESKDLARSSRAPSSVILNLRRIPDPIRDPALQNLQKGVQCFSRSRLQNPAPDRQPPQKLFFCKTNPIHQSNPVFSLNSCPKRPSISVFFGAFCPGFALERALPLQPKVSTRSSATPSYLAHRGKSETF